LGGKGAMEACSKCKGTGMATDSGLPCIECGGKGGCLKGKEMTDLNSIRENRIKKMRQASAKFLALKAAFEKKAREAQADF